VIAALSIGARFLEIRKAKGLKQTDVAEAIGISHGALVNYEKGREPPASAILAFSQVYGVSANWLLTGEGRPDAESLDSIYARSIATAWAFLSRGGDDVEQDALIKLGGALFQYLGAWRDQPRHCEKILTLSDLTCRQPVAANCRRTPPEPQ
jgi:transcriptional regulator with XRE-family HTH domain